VRVSPQTWDAIEQRMLLVSRDWHSSRLDDNGVLSVLHSTKNRYTWNPIKTKPSSQSRVVLQSPSTSHLLTVKRLSTAVNAVII
jgi:hypothetical protein